MGSSQATEEGARRLTPLPISRISQPTQRRDPREFSGLSACPIPWHHDLAESPEVLAASPAGRRHLHYQGLSLKREVHTLPRGGGRGTPGATSLPPEVSRSGNQGKKGGGGGPLTAGNLSPPVSTIWRAQLLSRDPLLQYQPFSGLQQPPSSPPPLAGWEHLPELPASARLPTLCASPTSIWTFAKLPFVATSSLALCEGESPGGHVLTSPACENRGIIGKTMHYV